MAKIERELTYVPAASQAHIDNFIEMLWLEKGLSEHTQQSYRTDLSKLAIYSNNQGVKDIAVLTTEQLQDYLAYRHDKGLSTRFLPELLQEAQLAGNPESMNHRVTRYWVCR